MPSAIAEAPARQWASADAAARGVAKLREHELVALWLLGRVPPELLPWPLLRPGRGGRGPGPDVREAAFRSPEGVVRSGAVEVHLAASDFVRHGHDRDPAYGALVLHLVWLDDRSEAGAAQARSEGGAAPQPLAGGSATPQPVAGGGAAPQPVAGGGAAPQALPGGGVAPTCVVGPALGGDPAELRRLLRLGPSGAEPCVAATRSRGGAATSAAVRAEGRRRLAELAWGAAALASEHGWDRAWRLLLLRALTASAGRRTETAEAREALAARIDGALGREPLRRLAALALNARPGPLVEALRGGTLGRGRAAELGWNAALPLLAAQAAAFGDLALARGSAALIEAWPAPRPYGRTRALRELLGPPPPRAGALHGPGPAAPPGPLVRARRLRRLPSRPRGRPRRRGWRSPKATLKVRRPGDAALLASLGRRRNADHPLPTPSPDARNSAPIPRYVPGGTLPTASPWATATVWRWGRCRARTRGRRRRRGGGRRRRRSSRRCPCRARARG